MEESKLTPSMYFALKVMHFLGFHPFKYNWFAKIRSVTTVASLLLWTLVYIPPLINWEGIHTFHKIDLFPALFCVLLKAILFVSKREEIGELIAKVKLFWPIDALGAEQGAKMKRINDKMFQTCKIYAALVIADLFAFLIYSYRRHEIFLGEVPVCNITNDACYYTHIFFSTLSSIMHIVTTFPALDLMFLSFVMYVYVATENIKRALETLYLNPRCEDDAEVCKRNLVEIVHQHNVVLDFIKRLNKLFSTFLLAIFWLSSSSIVFFLFMITSKGIPPAIESVTRYGAMIGTFAFGLAIYSFGGSIIYEQTLSIADSAYATQWYIKNQGTERINLAFIIKRSQKVGRLRVGDMSDLNLVLFLSTMRNSLSLYTLLLTVSQNKV